MKVGMLAIGNELLDGMVQESNSGYIGRELFARGHTLEEVVIVKDNTDAVMTGLKNLSKLGFIITTGGLGPTDDDLTRECVASFAGAKLVRDDEQLLSIRKRFERMRISMPESNKKQADRPEGALIIPNPRGTAPGFMIQCPNQNTVITSLPGVPSEMEAMFPFVLDQLDQLSPPEVKSYSIYFKTIGEAESLLNDQIRKAGGPDLEFGTIAQQGIVTVRLDIPSPDKASAVNTVTSFLDNIPELKRHVFTMDRTETIQQAVYNLLVKQNRKVMFAESCTGGLVSKLITDIPGSSSAFLGSFITYDNSLKEIALDIKSDILKKFGAVSYETAAAMLDGLAKYGKADYAVSITGIAGPDGGSPEKPVGTVYIGLKTPNQSTVFHFQSPGSRDSIRHRTAIRVFELLWQDLRYGTIDVSNMMGFVEAQSAG